MTDSFEDYSVALRTRRVIERIATSVVDKMRPKYRYATVISINFAARTAVVQYTGDDGTIKVNTWRAQPTKVGQYVRVEGIGRDRYISDVKGSWSITQSYTGAIGAGGTFKIPHGLGVVPTFVFLEPEDGTTRPTYSYKKTAVDSINITVLVTVMNTAVVATSGQTAKVSYRCEISP